MNAERNSTEFRQQERVLWRVLLSLSKSGFFVPLDDARDLIHDFYVEAWEGLRTRYDPSLANFSTYVAGAFHQFARRRAVQMERSRRQLVDLEEVGDLISPDLGPAASLERKQDVKLLRGALQNLSALERVLLVAHFGEDRQSERVLAERYSLTRYAVRAALAAALHSVSVNLRGSIPGPVFFSAPPRQKLGADNGYVKPDPSSDRPAWRVPNDSDMSTRSTPWTNYSLSPEILPMNDFDQRAIRAALFDGSERALSYLAENAERLRSSLAESDDFEIEMPGLEFLRENPDNLSRLYEVLLSDQGEEEITEVEWVIEQARRESAIEVGEAFDLMAEDLPQELLRWEDWFSELPDGEHYREYLAGQPSVIGRHAYQLTRYGMTPDTIAGAMRGLQLLFDEHLEDSTVEDSADYRENSLLLVGSDRSVILPAGQIEAELSLGPFVPRLEDMPARLTNWVIALLIQRPFCVPNYTFDRETHGRLAAVSIPEWERTPRPDLRALWSRPERQVRERLVYR